MSKFRWSLIDVRLIYCLLLDLIDVSNKFLSYFITIYVAILLDFCMKLKRFIVKKIMGATNTREKRPEIYMSVVSKNAIFWTFMVKIACSIICFSV